MSNILDLRDIKPPQKTENINPVPSISAPRINPEDISQKQLTPDQAKLTALTFYFERENGEVFSTSAVDAHNIRERNDRTLKFLGATDGSEYRRIMNENRSIIAPLKKRIAEIGTIALELQDAISVELMDEQNECYRKIEEIDKKAIKADAEIARRTKSVLPDFSVVGDAGGVKRFLEKNG